MTKENEVTEEKKNKPETRRRIVSCDVRLIVSKKAVSLRFAEGKSRI